MMVYANMSKINYCLGLINGATLLPEKLHWSSTESSASHAWDLHFETGLMDYSTKAIRKFMIRPVSAFVS